MIVVEMLIETLKLLQVLSKHYLIVFKDRDISSVIAYSQNGP